MKILKPLWESYRGRVIPQGAPPVQIMECRRAFYSGAGALLGKLMAQASDGDDITPEDEQMLMTVQQELEEYLAESMVELGRRPS